MFSSYLYINQLIQNLSTQGKESTLEAVLMSPQRPYIICKGALSLNHARALYFSKRKCDYQFLLAEQSMSPTAGTILQMA